MPLTTKKITHYVMNDQPVCPHCDEQINAFTTDRNYLHRPGTHQVCCEHCQRTVMVHSEPVYWFSTDEQKAA